MTLTDRCNFLLKRTRSRIESREVPVPITRSLGKPLIRCAIVVRISTGLLEITKTPVNPLLTIGSIIDLRIVVFLLTRSKRVSPGLRGIPAVITTTSASAASS